MVIRRQRNPFRFAARHVPPYGCRQHSRNDRIALVRVNATLDGQMPLGPHTAHAEPGAARNEGRAMLAVNSYVSLAALMRELDR